MTAPFIEKNPEYFCYRLLWKSQSVITFRKTDTLPELVENSDIVIYSVSLKIVPETKDDV